MDYIKELNEPQAKAVKIVEGPIMIIAGAGSGKTRVLTFRIAYLVEHGIDPFNILALTFTNKAAREMKDRIAKVVGETEARNLWMGTFHSIFSRILRSEAEKMGYPNNFTIYDTDDSKSLLKSIIKEMGLDDKIYKPNLVYNRISSAKNSLINAIAYKMNENIQMDDLEARRPKLSTIYEKYAMRCFKSSAMDFDDLLLKTFELFHKYPDVLHKYQHRFKFVMVDEFQDTNYAQYAIIKQLSALYQNICVVGDDAQSIYAFRGADITNILNFKKDFPDLKTCKLEQNYRSTKNIVAAANSVIAKNKHQLDKSVWTNNQEGNKIKVFKAVTDNEEGNFVAQSIFDHKMNHQLANSEFAVLYRTNAQSRALEEALRRQNIPYRIYGGLSFYQRKEIKDILSYFRLIINHNDEEALKRIINYPVRGIGKTTLDRIIIAASENLMGVWQVLENLRKMNIRLSPAVIKKIEEFMFSIRGFAVMVQQKNAFEAASFIASSTGLLKDLYNDKTPEGVSRYENVQELLNGIKEFTENNKENPDGNFLFQFMEDIALLTDADKNYDDESDRDRVSLMTLHSSKGLEFPYVFIVGLEENLFPSQLSINSRDELEEERRLFYVGITRAMQQLTFSFAQTRYRYGNLIQSDASRFLQEIDHNYLDIPMGNNQNVFKVKHIGVSGNNLSSYSIPAHSHLKKVNGAMVSNFNGDSVASFKAGLEVLHLRFGKGKIVSIDGNGENKMATIQFEKDGQKKLLLKFAKLQVINE